MAYLLGAMLDPFMFLPVLAAVLNTKDWRVLPRFFIALAAALAFAVVAGAAIWADAGRIARHIPIVLSGSALWFFMFYGFGLLFKRLSV